MIICHSKKFIFIKPRKVASTSIAVWLSQYCDENDVVGRMSEMSSSSKKIYQARNFTAKDGYVLEKHESLRNAMDHGIITPTMMKEYTVFTVERNSFEKAVSLWCFLKDKGGFKKEYGKLTFPEFLRCPFNKSDFFQYSLNGKVAVDVVIQFHELNEGFKRLSKKLGISYQLEEFKEKTKFRNKNKHYSTYYTKEDIDVCKKIYKKEIDAFGYTYSG